jgi:Na+-driven multidrug efflux pump
MLVSLFTSRIVLQTLGVTDYGINNVVGGVVAMLSFLSNSVANAMNRFFSFELGKKDYQKLHKIFCLIMLTFIIIGVIVVVLS